MSSSVSSTSSSRKVVASLNSLGTVTTPTIINKDLDAGVEDSVAFGADIRIIRFKARGCVEVTYAYTALAAAYLTLDPGNMISLPQVSATTPITIYFTADVDAVLEIETWA